MSLLDAEGRKEMRRGMTWEEGREAEGDGGRGNRWNVGGRQGGMMVGRMRGTVRRRHYKNSGRETRVMVGGNREGWREGGREGGTMCEDPNDSCVMNSLTDG